MKITELLTAETIKLDLDASTKNDVLGELTDVLLQANKLNDPSLFLEALQKREESSTTGVGDGIAIPHAKTSAVKEPAIAFGRKKDGVDYQSLDGKPATLFFMIAATEGANNFHLEALSRLAGFLIDEQFTAKLRHASTKEEILAAIEEKELANEEKKSVVEAPEKTHVKKLRILAVTACPTGIAHTYMAAEKLEEVAKERDISIKVETNGSSGAQNILTAKDIAEADAIIVAADTKVELARFEGKKVIQVAVSKAIYEPNLLFDRAEKTGGSVYHHQGSSDDTSEEDVEQGKNSISSQIYKHLMNGVSNMLPFVVGGGILIAISFFFGIHSAEKGHTEYNEFAYMLKTIGGENAFLLMVPVLAGFIAMSIADRPGFAPGMVGGLLAITVKNAEGANSGFLGGLIAGFLAGYIVLGLKKLFSKLPKSFEGLKPILIYPLLGIFSVGIIMMLLNPQLTKLYTAFSELLNSLNGSNVILLGIVLAAMMAFDLGGPLNKAAYTFGIAMLDAGNYHIMAAVMAGGMVPPLGVALATSIFRNRFTKQERDTGKTSYVLGAFFISEGAIPFAASDPLRMIPSFVVGAAVTGGLTMAFKIGLPVPHGGIFVFPLVDGGGMNIVLYALAIIIGAVVTALMIGLLKKKKTI